MNPPTSEPDRLSGTLAAWRVDPPIDPNFRPAVWQRLRRSAGESWAGYLRAHLLGWSIAACIAVAGAGWAGRAAGRAKLEADRDRMVVSYLGEIDPRVMVKLRPAP